MNADNNIKKIKKNTCSVKLQMVKIIFSLSFFFVIQIHHLMLELKSQTSKQELDKQKNNLQIFYAVNINNKRLKRIEP